MCQQADDVSFDSLAAIWSRAPGAEPAPAQDLFYPDRKPRVYMATDFWRPLIDKYFAHYRVPRSAFASVWLRIVQCIMAAPHEPAMPYPASFFAWAYGCALSYVIADSRPAVCPDSSRRRS